MNRQLTIQQMIAFLLRGLGANFQNGVILKLNSFVAPDADQMMVMMGMRLIQFVMLMAFGEFKLSEDPHPRHQLQSPIDRR